MVRCLWYRHPSAFAAECRYDTLGILFVPALHRLGTIPFTSDHQSQKPPSPQNYLTITLLKICRSSLSGFLLSHTNLINSNRLWGKTSSCRESAFSCSYVAKSPTHFYVYPILSKSIYFHPPGTKPSLKPPELTQKPFNFKHSLFIYFYLVQLSPFHISCHPLITNPTNFNWAVYLRTSGAYPIFSLPPITRGFPHCSLCFSLPFSATLSSMPPLFQTAELAPGTNCFSQHKSPQR